jgi:hypothetical protein
MVNQFSIKFDGSRFYQENSQGYRGHWQKKGKILIDEFYIVYTKKILAKGVAVDYQRI